MRDFFISAFEVIVHVVVVLRCYWGSCWRP